MSPVHVIVGDDPRAEAMWTQAFTGAVDIYGFARNVDAFERLTAAQAPVDLVVLTPAQRGPFNLTPDQFVARVLEGTLGTSPYLSNLHVIVVGSPLQHSHPRAMAVSTLDAAIRLVKFGEVERAPRPQPMQIPTVAAPQAAARTAMPSSSLDDVPFAGSVISRIWSAGDESAPRAVESHPQPATGFASQAATQFAMHQEGAPVQRQQPGEIVGGGAPATEPAPTPLFTRAAPRGFVEAGGAAAAHMAPAAPAAVAHEFDPAAMHRGVPHETIQVASGTVLQGARPFVLEGGGAYRGPAVRGGVVNAATHDVMSGGQPVPPALGAQVEAMVYGNGMQVGNPHDPVLVFTSTARGAAQPAPGAQPAYAQPPHAQTTPVPTAVVVPGTVQVHAPSTAIPVAAHVRTLPMEPPVGAYAGAPAAPSNDRFLARAEAGGGSVSFG